MKIAIIIPSMHLSGGIERVTSVQANYWVEKKGYEVLFITTENKECSSFYHLNENIRVINIDDTSKKRICKIRGIRFFYLLRNLSNKYRNLLESENPDILISTMHGSENFLSSLASIGIPIIGVNHVSLNLRNGDYINKKLLRYKSKLMLLLWQLKIFRKYDAIVSLSKTDCQIFKKLGCKSFYIPNPCSFDSYNICITLKRAKRIVMVGRMDYLKGQDRLLNIWKQLSLKNTNWILTLVGDGPNYEKNLSLIEKYGLTNSVEIIRNTNDVRSILLNSSIFAFTSRTESFGMVILEAFSCGLPVIAYDCESGPRDLIDNYYNGFLIQDDDSCHFSNKLQLLMSNEHLRSKLMINAIQSSIRFNQNIVMKQWDDLLDLVSNSNN